MITFNDAESFSIPDVTAYRILEDFRFSDKLCRFVRRYRVSAVRGRLSKMLMKIDFTANLPGLRHKSYFTNMLLIPAVQSSRKICVKHRLFTIPVVISSISITGAGIRS